MRKRRCRSRSSRPPSRAFARFRFPPEVTLLAVRWHLRYGPLTARRRTPRRTRDRPRPRHHLPLGPAVHPNADRRSTRNRRCARWSFGEKKDAAADMGTISGRSGWWCCHRARWWLTQPRRRSSENRCSARTAAVRRNAKVPHRRGQDLPGPQVRRSGSASGIELRLACPLADK